MDGATIRGFFLLCLAFVAYFVPTVIAYLRGHHASVPIFWVNLLLGWTVLGWVAVLVWAMGRVRLYDW
jgi:hypothetical protein